MHDYAESMGENGVNNEATKHIMLQMYLGRSIVRPIERRAAKGFHSKSGGTSSK